MTATLCLPRSGVVFPDKKQVGVGLVTTHVARSDVSAGNALTDVLYGAYNPGYVARSPLFLFMLLIWASAVNYRTRSANLSTTTLRKCSRLDPELCQSLQRGLVH